MTHECVCFTYTLIKMLNDLDQEFRCFFFRGEINIYKTEFIKIKYMNLFKFRLNLFVYIV